MEKLEAVMEAQAKLLPQNRPSCPKDVNAAIKLPTTRRGAAASSPRPGSRIVFNGLMSASIARSEAHQAMRAWCRHEARRVLTVEVGGRAPPATHPRYRMQRA